MKRRWPLLILIASAGLFALILLQLARPPQSPSVSFLGYTNQNGSTVASFRIQNGNRGTVTLFADAILWSRAQRRPPPKGVPPKRGPWFMSVQTLKSGEETVVQIAPPTNGAPWQTAFELVWHGTLWSQFCNMWEWGDAFQPTTEERVTQLRTGTIPANKNGAANGSQPIRLETNRTSSPADSRR